MKHILSSSLFIVFNVISVIPSSAEVPSMSNMELTKKVLIENGHQDLSKAKITQFFHALEDIDTHSKTSNFNHLTEANKQDLVECSALLHSSKGTVLVDELKVCYGFRTME